MKQDYTYIAVVLDRSGSMEAIRDDVIGGFNGFLNGQRQVPGKSDLRLVQFDSQDPYEIVYHGSLDKAPELNRERFVPRSTTPLYDCLGRTINDVGKELADKDEADRPEKVVFVVVTDGLENASHEFNHAQVRSMIETQQNTYSWEFVFLSADITATNQAVALGFDPSKTMSFDNSAIGTENAWQSVTTNVASYRAGTSRTAAFSSSDRSKQDNEQKRSKTT